MYVREMKAKYNKEYKHLNFDEIIVQKQEEEKKQKEKEEEEKFKIRSKNQMILYKISFTKNILQKKNQNM